MSEVAAALDNLSTTKKAPQIEDALDVTVDVDDYDGLVLENKEVLYVPRDMLEDMTVDELVDRAERLFRGV